MQSKRPPKRVKVKNLAAKEQKPVKGGSLNYTKIAF